MQKLDDLKEYGNNPRINDHAVEEVAESIKQFGFKVPIIVDHDNVIIAGHTRLKASYRLGLEEVPTVVADDLTDEQARAFRLADNKVSEKSEWDQALLELELLELDEEMMQKLGFDVMEEELEKSQDSNKKRLKSMELRAFEHYDYLVFVFKNQQDWLNAVNAFGIERVDAGYGKTKKVGVGRVLDGKRLLEEVRDQSSSDQQGESNLDHEEHGEDHT